MQALHASSTPHTSPPSLHQALWWATYQGLPPLDAERILLHALNRAVNSKAWLRAHDTDALTDNAWSVFTQGVVRRLGHEPLAYITGKRGFYGLQLQIDARVLDPRPDTETLVDWALEVLQPLATPRVADLGTGSGAIALALKHQRSDADVTAIDASADALAVATANAERLGLTLTLAHGHWLQPLKKLAEQLNPTQGWDLVVSNPPYIAENDPHLAKLHHEPRQALTSGVDGLDDLRHLVAHTPSVLRPGGWLLLEHGYDQAEAVRALLAQRGFASVQSRKDLAGIERCSGGVWPGADNEG